MAYTPPNPNGQNTMANSAPVVIASNQSAVPASQSGAWNMGQSGSWTVTANQGGAWSVSITGSVAVTGPLTDTQLRASAVPVSMASVPTHAVTLTSTTITGSVAITAASLPLPTGASTETTLAALSAKLPTAAASADGTANPTVTQMGAEVMGFNGTTWDRQRNNYHTTTGDTGAKTATFGGATQTNYNARGAYITVLISAVSGTTPTCAIYLQYSVDGGTTWATYGPAPLVTATIAGNYYFCVYPAGLGSGASIGNLALGGSTASALVNAPLPRTWRLAYVIGGTTPSFTISAVWVNYAL